MSEISTNVTGENECPECGSEWLEVKVRFNSMMKVTGARFFDKGGVNVDIDMSQMEGRPSRITPLRLVCQHCKHAWPARKVDIVSTEGRE